VAFVAAAAVEHAHQVALGDGACGGVLRVDLHERAALDVAQALEVDEGGVQEVARRRRDHGQRVQAGAARRPVVGQVCGQRVQPARGQAVAVELALARGRGKAALGKRRVRHRQRSEALLGQQDEVHCVPEGLAAQLLHVGKGVGAVDVRLARTQQVQVGAVEDEDGFAHGRGAAATGKGRLCGP